MTVFEIVAPRNVCSRSAKTVLTNIFAKKIACCLKLQLPIVFFKENRLLIRHASS